MYLCIYAVLRGTAGDPALGEVDDAYTTDATTRKTKGTAGTHIHMFTCFTSTKVPVLTPDGDAKLSVHNLKVLNLGSFSKGPGALVKQQVKQQVKQ
jgi:hypothetical protein